MATLVKEGPFTKVLRVGADRGIIPNKTQAARTWYRDAAAKFSSLQPEDFFSNGLTGSARRSDLVLTNRLLIGRMYMFFYDAKTKAKLPYWDMFPMIFPIKRLEDGFLGINLHYLHPTLRAKLMDALYTLAINTEFDDSTKLRISYNILKSASNMKLFKPCIKRYLSSHFRSRFVYVSPESWDVALFLPLERFQKKSKEYVWEQSEKIAGA